MKEAAVKQEEEEGEENLADSASNLFNKSTEDFR